MIMCDFEDDVETDPTNPSLEVMKQAISSSIPYDAAPYKSWSGGCCEIY